MWPKFLNPFKKNKKNENPLNYYEFNDKLWGDSFDGTSWAGGWGVEKDFRLIDIKKLQFRSLQLYRENSIASNIFNTFSLGVLDDGLKLKLETNNFILKLDEKEIKQKKNEILNRWNLFAEQKITKNKKDNFRSACEKILNAVLLSGDCLVIIELNKNLMPVIEIVDGLNISNPKISVDKNLIDGVLLDKNTGEEKSFFVDVGLFESVEIKAFSQKGRRRCFLVKSHLSKRINDIRGVPLLSPVMQMINESGKAIKSEQRAGYVNSVLALTHTKAENQIANRKNAGFGSFGGGAEVVQANGAGTVDFKYGQAGMIRGNLNYGESLTSFDTKRPNLNMVEFNERIIDNISSALGIPPEILRKSFNSNYSASRQSTKMWFNQTKSLTKNFTDQFAKYFFSLWLDVMVLNDRISLKGYLDALLRDDTDTLEAWRSHRWAGSSDENIDVYKQARADELAVANGWQTNADIAQKRYDADFYSNARALKQEQDVLNEVYPKGDGVEKV